MVGAGAFFGDTAVGDAGVFGGEVEVEHAEEVSLVVGKEGVLVGIVGVNVGDFSGLEFVERVAEIEAELEHLMAVTITSEEKDPADFLVADERENFVALSGVPLPRVFATFVSVFGPEGAGAEDFEF